MRSRSRTGMTGRCPRCHVLVAHCVCAAIPEVPTRTEILVIRHAREAYRSTNTARIAALALPQLRMIDYEDAGQALDAVEAALLPGACALFPHGEAPAWPAQITQLVVLDGTWRETRRMRHRLTPLHTLPSLALPPKPEPVLRLRVPTFEGGRSTLEAIADALGVLEGPEPAAALHALHAHYVEQVFRARGAWGYHAPESGED